MKDNQQKILACIDDSDISGAVCDYAAWISAQTATPLELLHTVNHHARSARTDMSGSIGLGSQEHLLEELSDLELLRSKLWLKQGKLMLESAKERVIEACAGDVKILQRHGGLAESLVELEERIQVLVLGMEGRQDNSPHLSSQLETVIRSLHRPMLIVNHEFKLPERIMIAYDGGEAADKAVNMVAGNPLYKDLECHLICVNKNSDTAEALLKKAGDRLQAAGIRLTCTRLEGKPEIELCSYQEDKQIDLIVMGAFSHTRIHDLFLGSFTVKMLLNTQKPLLLLR